MDHLLLYVQVCFCEPIVFHAFATVPPQINSLMSPMCSPRGELLQSVHTFHNVLVLSIIRLPIPLWRSFNLQCCEEM